MTVHLAINNQGATIARSKCLCASCEFRAADGRSCARSHHRAPEDGRGCPLYRYDCDASPKAQKRKSAQVPPSKRPVSVVSVITGEVLSSWENGGAAADHYGFQTGTVITACKSKSIAIDRQIAFRFSDEVDPCEPLKRQAPLVAFNEENELVCFAISDAAMARALACSVKEVRTMKLSDCHRFKVRRMLYMGQYKELLGDRLALIAA